MVTQIPLVVVVCRECGDLVKTSQVPTSAGGDWWALLDVVCRKCRADTDAPLGALRLSEVGDEVE